MARARTETERVDRREAGKAVAEAKRAGKEARKLAKTLSHDARASLEAVAASAQAQVRAADHERKASPRHAKRMAQRAAAKLERASVRVVGPGGTANRALAEADAKKRAKKRAKTIKRHRAQVKQAHKMAKFIAFHTIAASVVTPTDEERTEEDLKRVRRRAENADRAGAENVETRQVAPPTSVP
jgi:threonine aldolase